MRLKRIILLIIIILIILLFPIKSQYKDGGTITYTSLTYKIIKWYRLDEYYKNGLKIATDVYLFPKNFKPLDYYEEVKPPRFSLIYKDKLYYSEVLSYCWSNQYNSICADTLGPTEIKYKETIEVTKNEKLNYGTFLPISNIKLFNENGVVDYPIEYSNQDEFISVPNLTGTYFIQLYYKCPEGNVSYAFKLNIK